MEDKHRDILHYLDYHLAGKSSLSADDLKMGDAQTIKDLAQARRAFVESLAYETGLEGAALKPETYSPVAEAPEPDSDVDFPALLAMLQAAARNHPDMTVSEFCRYRAPTKRPGPLIQITNEVEAKPARPINL